MEEIKQHSQRDKWYSYTNSYNTVYSRQWREIIIPCNKWCKKDIHKSVVSHCSACASQNTFRKV